MCTIYISFHDTTFGLKRSRSRNKQIAYLVSQSPMRNSFSSTLFSFLKIFIDPSAYNLILVHINNVNIYDKYNKII